METNTTTAHAIAVKRFSKARRLLHKAYQELYEVDAILTIRARSNTDVPLTGEMLDEYKSVGEDLNEIVTGIRYALLHNPTLLNNSPLDENN